MTYAKYPSLNGRGVFITGGGSGIGASFVSAFKAQGANVAYVDLHPAEPKDGIWQRPCDVTDINALAEALRLAQTEIGPIQVLINNVANDTRHAADEMTLERWRTSLAVNLDHVFHASRLLHPPMKVAGGGSIINLSSINALLGPPNMAAYVAAKSAILGLTKSLAREWGADSIRVNAISPGWVVTERQLELWLTPEAEAEWAEQTALGGRLKPDDVARLALFLGSDDSSMITGQNFVIDAGRT